MYMILQLAYKCVNHKAICDDQFYELPWQGYRMPRELIMLFLDKCGLY